MMENIDNKCCGHFAKDSQKTEPKQERPSAPPGPRGPPLIGQAFNLDTDHMHIQFMEWQKRFGDMFMFKVFGKHYLVISHPDILRKMFIECEHAQMFNDRPASFMGKYVIERTKDIVFRNHDEKQTILKREALDYIENRLLEEQWFYGSVYEELKDVVKHFDTVQGSPVDILAVLDSLSTKVIGLLLSGKRIRPEDPEYACLSGFMDTGSKLGTVKNQTVLTKLPGVRKIPGHLKELYDLLSVDKEKLKKYFITDNSNENGLVAHLKQLSSRLVKEGQEAWLDEDFIMGVIMDLTAAGIVPLQNTLSVLFLVLVHHPSVQENIRNEIKKTMTSQHTSVSVKDFDKMPYSAACMLELKRFHTPLPISARHSNRSGIAKFESYTIPKNTEIFSNLFGIHHDERFWSDPWSYTPERFLADDGNVVSHDHPIMKNFVATGVGPRQCVGSKFSERIMFLTAVNILSRFKLETVSDQPAPPCDPRQFQPGVVTRAPTFKCKLVVSESN